MKDRPTWSDVFRQRDPDYDARRAEAKHRELLDAQGCVIRALNSILGVPLTRAQEELRFGLAEPNTTDLLDVLFDRKSRGEALNVDAQIHTMIKAEQERILGYIRQLASQTNTPAGRELQRYHIQLAELRLPDMHALHQAGHKLMLMLLIPHHAAHVVPLTHDSFALLSDGNVRATGLDPKGVYDALVFNLRG